jgi:hypothetical protein
MAEHKITIESAIRERCSSCFGDECKQSDCHLHGYAADASKKGRTEAVRRYCSWCMGGNPISQCASASCPVHNFRTDKKVSSIRRF